MNFFKKIPKIFLPLCTAIVAVLTLVGCVPATDMSTATALDTPNSGAVLLLGNCTYTTETASYWAAEAADPVTLPLLRANGAPVLQAGEGVEVTLTFCSPREDGYAYYGDMMPSNPVDYRITPQADGTTWYHLDTVYSFLVTVATPDGADQYIILCEREI